MIFAPNDLAQCDKALARYRKTLARVRPYKGRAPAELGDWIRAGATPPRMAFVPFIQFCELDTNHANEA
jgi:hypothetical protein